MINSNLLDGICVLSKARPGFILFYTELQYRSVSSVSAFYANLQSHPLERGTHAGKLSHTDTCTRACTHTHTISAAETVSRRDSRLCSGGPLLWLRGTREGEGGGATAGQRGASHARALGTRYKAAFVCPLEVGPRWAAGTDGQGLGHGGEEDWEGQSK